MLLAVPLLMLPIALPAGWTPPDQNNPVFWLPSYVDSRDRTALSHVIDYGAVTTKMVFMDGSSLGSRSLFPVFGEQCGQYAGPAGLSSVH